MILPDLILTDEKTGGGYKAEGSSSSVHAADTGEHLIMCKYLVLQIVLQIHIRIHAADRNMS